MPRGTKHDETGWLREGLVYPTLQRDLGGTWQLDPPHGWRKLVGRRVRVVGSRSGFDLLDVTSIKPAE